MAPVLVAEPSLLLGYNTAPSPTEVVQALLVFYIAVGIQAIATHRGVTLTMTDISAVWDGGHR